MSQPQRLTPLPPFKVREVADSTDDDDEDDNEEDSA